MTALSEPIARQLVHAFMDGAEVLGESPEGGIYVLTELPPYLLSELEQFEANTVDDEEDDPAGTDLDGGEYAVDDEGEDQRDLREPENRP